MLNKDLRRRIVDIVTRAKEGHIPSSFSIVDIIDYLYDQVLKYNKFDSACPKRDFFVLSKGHGCAGLYVVLEKYGLLKSELLDSYSQKHGILGGHPDASKVPYVEASTGSLGHGFPFAVGIALGCMVKKQENRVVCLLGDGECHEGTIWEAAHVAANRKLSNLTAIIDWNESGAQLCPIDDLPAKWASFGWQVEVFKGHDYESISNICGLIGRAEKPLALIAENIKGKGVSFLEGHGKWHHKIPNTLEYEAIMEELA